MPDESRVEDTPSAAQKRELLASLLRERAEAGTGDYPLSYGQQALWFLHAMAPESSAYNLALVSRLRGPVDLGALESALRELVERHPALKTTFAMRSGEPVQRIEEAHDVELEVVDASGWAADDVRDDIDRQLHAPFDLETGSAYRFRLLRCSERESVLTFVVHHIVFDGRSAEIVSEDLLALYAAATGRASPPPRPSNAEYRDFVHWQRKLVAAQEGERQRLYWEQRLAGDLPVLDLPTDRPRGTAPSYRGDSVPISFGDERARALRALAKQAGTRPFTVLLATLAALLYRYTGQETIHVGAPVLGRTSAEFEAVVGYFINPVVFRAEISGNATFHEVLDAARQTVNAGLANQDYPFPLLVERLHPNRDSSYNPIFQVMMDWQSTGTLDEDFVSQLPDQDSARLNIGPLEFEPLFVRQQEGLFDLFLDVKQAGDRLFALLKYDAALFDAKTVERMAGHFCNLLDEVLTAPDRPISELSLLGEDERGQVLVDWNRTELAYPAESCVHHLVETRAGLCPGDVAASCEGRELRYDDLNGRANQLARHLRRLGVGPGTPVGMCTERGIDMLVVLLGILKAGGAYVPMDPTYPSNRVAYMLEDSGAPLIVTQESLLPGLPEDLPRVVLVDAEWDAVDRESRANLDDVATAPGDLAYLIYTSGSTGRPKGVRVPHRGVVNLLNSLTRWPGLVADDVLLAVSTVSFDIHAVELFLPLMVGARVEIAARGLASDGPRLLERLRAGGVTVMQATPSTWQMLIDAGWNDRLDLKVITTGEAIPGELARKLVERVSSAWNMYGPTETTIFSSGYRLRRGETRVTVGRPVANTQLYILDAERKPVPIGLAGELYIGGDGVTAGYVNLPEQTAERFVPNPFSTRPGALLYRTGDLARYRPDGEVDVIGRMDHQVKLRGFRIELGEIEAVLAEHPEVATAVVVARETAEGDKRLAAYGIPDAESRPDDGDLRAFLRQRLPEYMVPASFVWLDAFPLTPNGKIDRKALPDPPRARESSPDELAAPAGDLEVLMAAIWEDLLEVDGVSAYDTFFDLGGHSLLTLKVVDRFERETGVRISPGDLVTQTLRQVIAANATRVEPGTTPVGDRPRPGILESIKTALSRGG